MSKCCFQSDYFNVEADPDLDFMLQNQTERKLSYDQFLMDFFAPEQINDPSAEDCEIYKKKSRNISELRDSDRKANKRRYKIKTVTEGQQKGHWYMDENKRYHWFLQIHFNHFLNKQLRRTDRIFKIMQIFVASRQAEQCRSHHQKMEKKHGNFLAILKELRLQNYGSGDVDCVISDMVANGVSCSQQLIPWSILESGIQQKLDEVESQKSTINDCAQPVQSFIDPFLQIQVEKENLLEQLML